jgi:perosamine synthetase
MKLNDPIAMNSKSRPPSIPRISHQAYIYVNEVLRSEFKGSKNTGMLGRLENSFKRKFGARYAIGHSNGTATLHSALAAVGVQAGDEVIVPPLTMASTSLAVLHQNAVPVYADVDPHTFVIDPKSIRRLVTNRTRAIIPVSLYGLSPDMEGIMDIAEEFNVKVIEDAAQCFLGYFRGRVVGAIGHLGSFSFENSKHMTCGEGGMIVCNDATMAEKVRRFSVLGYAGVGGEAGQSTINKDALLSPNYARHTGYGWNYRMPDLCAAVALEQVERLEELVQMRTENAKLYQEAVGDCEWLTPQFTPADCVHARWSYVLRLNCNAIGADWQTFTAKFRECGGDRIYAAWRLTYLEPFFQQIAPRLATHQQWTPGLCPNAETIQPELVQLKTNYLDLQVAAQKADALRKTIRFFEGRSGRRLLKGCPASTTDG